jgi:hypothetical protein
MTRSRSDDTFTNMRHAGDVVASVLHEVATIGATDKEVLRTHPGKGLTNLELGLPRILDHAANRGVGKEGRELIEAKVRQEFTKGAEMCESPIERNMLAALLTAAWVGLDVFPPLVHDHRKQNHELLPAVPVVIIPQLAFVRYRLDFGIAIIKDRRLQLVAIECDGAAYHRDFDIENERVGYMRSWDIPVFKAKGTDLYEDAIREADRVVHGICEWWAK